MTCLISCDRLPVLSWVFLAMLQLPVVPRCVLAQDSGQPVAKADQALPRLDDYWIERKTRFGLITAEEADTIDVVFLGDSITEWWPRDGANSWNQLSESASPGNSPSLKIANFGISADRTENTLALLSSGILQPFRGRKTDKPVVFVLLIGTNNSHGDECSAAEIASGIVANANTVLDQVPNSCLLLLHILPRNLNADSQRSKVAVASQLAHDQLAGNPRVRHVNAGAVYVKDNGEIDRDLMPDTLHLSERGYELLGNRIKPVLTRFLHPRRNPAQLNPLVDLRGAFEQAGIAIRQQGRRGACQVFAFTSALEWSLRASDTAKKQTDVSLEIDLSEQYLMWASNWATNNTRIDGFNPDLLISGLRAQGICDESQCKYVPVRTPIERPSIEAIAQARHNKSFRFESIQHWTDPIGFDDSDIERVCQKLDHGEVVITTLCWPFNLSDEAIVDDQSFLKDAGIDGNSKDGHGVVVVGYGRGDEFPGGGYWIIRNSWGTWFGEKGYAYISFEFAKKYGIDLYQVSIVR